MPVHVLELDYDFWFEIDKADGVLQKFERPALNSDGHLYYILYRGILDDSKVWVNSDGFETVELAVEHAQSRLPAPISWR
jgi:hypothetical protein